MQPPPLTWCIENYNSSIVMFTSNTIVGVGVSFVHFNVVADDNMVNGHAYNDGGDLLTCNCLK
jgi:hypothetical protein